MDASSAPTVVPGQPASAPVKLRLRDVTKSFDHSVQPVVALQAVSLEVSEGECVVLFGPSGCGKSTVLNLIAGFETATSGEITLDGQPVREPGSDRLMLFQEHALFPWLNVIDNVMYGLRWQRPYRFRLRARRRKAMELLKLVHLEEFAGSAVHELSGGMKQRVALARALAPDPKVLLIDEPFPALDALVRAKLYGELQEILVRTRKTIVAVPTTRGKPHALGIACWCSPAGLGELKARSRSTCRVREISTIARSANTRAGSMLSWKATMKKNPEKRLKYYVLGFYLLLLATWQTLFSLKLIPDYLFPSPTLVARRLWELGADGMLWPSMEATLTRMAVGFGISAGIGLLVGLLMGLNRVINGCLRSLFLGLQTLPTAAWVPISLLIFGLSDRGVYFVIIMSSVAAIAIATSHGILHIPPIYLRVGRTLGTPAYAMPVRIVLPAALPSIVTGIKLGSDPRLARSRVSRAHQIQCRPRLFAPHGPRVERCLPSARNHADHDSVWSPARSFPLRLGGETDPPALGLGTVNVGQSAKGQSAKGQSSKGQSSKGQSSKGQSSKGQSSKGQSSRGKAQRGKAQSAKLKAQGSKLKSQIANRHRLTSSDQKSSAGSANPSGPGPSPRAAVDLGFFGVLGRLVSLCRRCRSARGTARRPVCRRPFRR